MNCFLDEEALRYVDLEHKREGTDSGFLGEMLNFIIMVMVMTSVLTMTITTASSPPAKTSFPVYPIKRHLQIVQVRTMETSFPHSIGLNLRGIEITDWTE